MGIFSERNLYAGVNPHLNSFLQNIPGKWQGFHTLHIGDLFRALDDALPDGYACSAEESIQIQVSDIDFEIHRSLTKPDITVYQTERNKGFATAATLEPSVPFAVLDLDSVEYIDEPSSGIVIYKVDPASYPGTPVTRLELISPANKPKGVHHSTYLQKRYETLKAGLNLIEIDYLHQLRPVLSEIPSYPDSDDGAFPFLVIVSNPHPDFSQGKAELYGSMVDSPLPTIEIPLLEGDRCIFDLNIPYNQTCTAGRRYRYEAIDYSQLPLAFERYSPADQERIRARMAAIAAEYASQ